jgi:polyferredoxin
MGSSLNQQIVDAGSLISLLLVFVFAYVSAIFPMFEEVRHRQRPNAIDDREALIRQLSTYRLIGIGLLILVVLVALLLSPLSWHAAHSDLLSPFQTIRVALILVDVLLVTTGIVIGVELILLTRRCRRLRALTLEPHEAETR